MKKKPNKLPKVTFIMLTLNVEGILPKSIGAIRSQNYPQELIEIIIADGGSKDKTVEIAKAANAKIIFNPSTYHEGGKVLALKLAKGKIAFFTDSDNVLSNPNWVSSMVKAYLENPSIKGLLAQTIPAPDSNSFDRYLGYLATDPFTWFVYQKAASARTYDNLYSIVRSTPDYIVYQFDPTNHPLVGHAQGFGVITPYKKTSLDDIIPIINMISKGGLIAYVPNAGVYHYHIKKISDFIKKYTWKINNNLSKKIKGIGLTERQNYLTPERKMRQFLFPLYSLSIIFPLKDSLGLFFRYKDPVVFWHPFACILLSSLILKEGFLYLIGMGKEMGKYGK